MRTAGINFQRREEAKNENRNKVKLFEFFGEQMHYINVR